MTLNEEKIKNKANTRGINMLNKCMLTPQSGLVSIFLYLWVFTCAEVGKSNVNSAVKCQSSCFYTKEYTNSILYSLSIKY